MNLVLKTTGMSGLPVSDIMTRPNLFEIAFAGVVSMGLGYYFVPGAGSFAMAGLIGLISAGSVLVALVLLQLFGIKTDKI